MTTVFKAMDGRGRRMAWISCLAGSGVALLLLFIFDPVKVPIFPVCPFHRLTGLDCPGCGSLRALHQLLHGNVVAALRYNAFLILSLPLLAWVGYRLVRREFRGGPPVNVPQMWLWTYLAVWLGFSILRELPFPPFAALAP